MKRPYLLGWECHSNLYVRFEDVDINELCLYPELFRASLPYPMDWDTEQNAYRLTLHAVQEISLLAHRHFGARSFTYLGVGLS